MGDDNVFLQISREERQFKFRTLMLDKEATFPHTFFDSKPQKQTVIISSNSSAYRESSLHTVQNWLIGKEMPESKTTVAFLYEYALEFSKKS